MPPLLTYNYFPRSRCAVLYVRVEQVVLMEKTKAQMDTRDIMREKIDRDFLYFSPIGATLGRKERHIGFVESNYMSTMADS